MKQKQLIAKMYLWVIKRGHRHVLISRCRVGLSHPVPRSSITSPRSTMARRILLCWLALLTAPYHLSFPVTPSSARSFHPTPRSQTHRQH